VGLGNKKNINTDPLKNMHEISGRFLKKILALMHINELNVQG
jgi:hypothetical protein